MTQGIRYAGLAVVLAGLVACSGAGDGGKPDLKGLKIPGMDEVDQAIPVEAVQVERRDISARYRGIATLEADRRTEVVAQVGGIIEQVLAEEGDRLEAGAELARLDDARYRLELKQARASLDKLRQNLQREKRLHEKNLGSAQQYEGLMHDLDMQQAQVELAELNLDHTRIRAPFAGIVDSREARVGMLVNSGQKLFGLYDPDTLQARVHVPERELAVLKPGLPAQIRVDAYPTVTFSGSVLRISPVVDAASGTVAVTVGLRPDARLRPGMFVRLDIPYDTHEQVAVVPLQALVERDGRQAVWKIGEEGTVSWQEVQTGYREQGFVEVLQGLQPGDRVVTLGRHSLKAGARVEVIDPFAPDEVDQEAMAASAEGKGSE